MISVVTREKMLENREKVGDNKATNLDGIMNMASKLKIMIGFRQGMFVDLYGESLVNGVLPISWKWQKLILSSEIVKPLGEPSSACSYPT